MCGVNAVINVSLAIGVVARTSELPSPALITKRGLIAIPPAAIFVGGCLAKMTPIVVRSVPSLPFAV
jgi:hypothetical protein